MKVAQGVATALVCLILFISLSVFGIGLFLNTTVLDKDFVIAQSENIEVAEIARDYLRENDIIELPTEIEFARPYVYDLVYEYEPWLRSQMEHVIADGYDYLHSERAQFDISVSLVEIKQTLNPELWDELTANLAEVMPDVLESELSRYIEDSLEEYIHLVPEDLLPPGTLDLPQEQLMDVLREYVNETNITIIFIAVPELKGLLEDALRPYYDQYINEYIEDIPNTYVLNEENLGATAMNDIEDARRYLGYYETGFYALIGVIVVLAVIVVVIYRDVFRPSLALGITFTLYGIAALAATQVGRTIDYAVYYPSEVPVEVSGWLTGVITDALAPLLWFSIGILVLGIVLVVIAILFHRRRRPE